MIHALVLAAGLTPLACFAIASDEWSQVYRIPAQGTSFLNGQSVGIHEDTIASVSSFLFFDFDKDESRNGITVSIYKRTPGGWVRDQSLNYFDEPTTQTLNGRVAISADRIVACSPAARRVVALMRNAEGAWVNDPGLNPNTGSPSTREAVIDADNVLIGSASNDGHVAVYGPNWSPIGALTSPAPDLRGRFGWSLAIDNDTIAIAEPGSRPTIDDPNIPATQGRVHIFTREGNFYTHAQTLETPAPQLGALFGHSVSMHAGVLAVGAPYNVNPDTPDGAVYLFERATDGSWSFSDLILAPESIPFDETGFGWNVELRANRLAVAAPLTPSGIHIYKRNDDDWSLTATLQTSLELTPGYSLAGNDDNIVFGAIGNSSTALYVAPRTPECFRDLRGDANNDGVTDFRDLNQVLADYGLEGDNLDADLNNDSVVDFIDLNFIVFTFGSPCLPPN